MTRLALLTLPCATVAFKISPYLMPSALGAGVGVTGAAGFAAYLDHTHPKATLMASHMADAFSQDAITSFGNAMLPLACVLFAVQTARRIGEAAAAEGGTEEAAGVQCYPVDLAGDDCETCELNEEFSEYYGEEIWICASAGSP